MNPRPSAPDLLQAVSEFIRDEATPTLDGAAAFHARVAMNVLEIVRREMHLGAAADADERARLQRLLHAAEEDLQRLNTDLCQRISLGDFGLHTPGLVDHLWRTTLARLAIDQPSYSTFLRHRASTGAKPGEQ